MNKLLHSKLFRKNLYKWLFLYVAVLCLATSVITYSKYISSLSRDDEARTAKFNVTIAPYTPTSLASSFKCSDDGKTCTTSTSFRPTQEVAYYYQVDPREIEVQTKITLRMTVDDTYRIMSISEVDAEGNIKVDAEKKPKILYEYVNESSLTKLTHSDKFKTNNFKTDFYVDEAELNKPSAQRELKYYKVVIKYIAVPNISGDYVFSTEDTSGLVGIGFSATQI